jgi:hypothetical protein
VAGDLDWAACPSLENVPHKHANTKIADRLMCLLLRMAMRFYTLFLSQSASLRYSSIVEDPTHYGHCTESGIVAEAVTVSLVAVTVTV